MDLKKMALLLLVIVVGVASAILIAGKAQDRMDANAQ